MTPSRLCLDRHPLRANPVGCRSLREPTLPERVMSGTINLSQQGRPSPHQPRAVRRTADAPVACPARRSSAVRHARASSRKAAHAVIRPRGLRALLAVACATRRPSRSTARTTIARGWRLPHALRWRLSCSSSSPQHMSGDAPSLCTGGERRSSQPEPVGPVAHAALHAPSTRRTPPDVVLGARCSPARRLAARRSARHRRLCRPPSPRLPSWRADDSMRARQAQRPCWRARRTHELSSSLRAGGGRRFRANTAAAPVHRQRLSRRMLRRIRCSRSSGGARRAQCSRLCRPHSHRQTPADRAPAALESIGGERACHARVHVLAAHGRVPRHILAPEPQRLPVNRLPSTTRPSTMRQQSPTPRVVD